MTVKKVLALIATGVFLVFCGVAIYFDIGGPSILTWTEAKIHTKIDAKLGPDGYQVPPELLKKKHANIIGLRDIVVQQAGVDLSDGNIGIDVTFAVTELKTTYIVKARGKGDVEFVDDRDGSFYFRPMPGTDGFKLVSVQSADGDAVGTKVGRLVERLAQSKTLQKLGVADDLLDAKDAIKLKAESFVQKYAALAAEAALKRVPVYKFKDDWKGWTAKHSYQGYSVSDVVENGVAVKAIVVKVSVWQLTGAVLTYAVGFVLLCGLMVMLALGGVVL